jgi:hypothetical protein
MTDLEEIKADVKSILKIMNGNGTRGCIAKQEELYDWMTQSKKNKWGLLDHVFKLVITVVVFYIASQIGLK